MPASFNEEPAPSTKYQTMAIVNGTMTQPLTEAISPPGARTAISSSGTVRSRRDGVAVEERRGDQRLAGDAYGRKDRRAVTKLALYNHAGDDLYSVFAQSRRIVDRMEQVLEGEVYLYHFR